MDEEIDITKLRYVLYVRKSTTDESRQIRSIPDQIFECEQLAQRIGLKVVDILKEEKSAKKPNLRPIFNQLLTDIKNGKYDAILAWNPDRLARNMKEGGEIIDMIDNNQIIDLKFVTHHFTKDANGKMLLGMAFVLSKQYSDDLSQKVIRGVRRGFSEGKSPAPKHGYYRNNEGLYKPDGKNFELIREAWEKRGDGMSLEEISEYMNKNGYTRLTKSGKKIKMTKQILTRIFKDPFYYGILIQAGQKVDLRDIYDFQPVINEHLYNFVQQLSYHRIKPNKPHKTAFYPLKMMIVCSFCGNNMYIGPSTGRTKRYLNARCDNGLCSRKKKSIRMINIFNFIYDFLEEGLNFSEKEYSDYHRNTSEISVMRRERLNIEIHSKQAVLKRLDSDLTDRSLNIIKLDKDSEIWKINENKISELGQQKQNLQETINKLKGQVTDPEEDRLSIEEFLNLSKNAAKIVQSANAIVKDQICRLIFLNLTVDETKVLSYQLKEPFATLLKQRGILSSRGGGT